MTTIDQYIHEIEFYGFTVIENVLDDDAIAGMKDALIRLEREVGVDHKHRGPARHVDNLPTLDPIFFPCIDHPRVLPVVENFLGNSLILGSLNARIVRPGDADQEFHSDVAEDMHNMASPVMVNTVSISWVTTIEVTPRRSCRERIRPLIRRTLTGSRPVVGSS